MRNLLRFLRIPATIELERGVWNVFSVAALLRPQQRLPGRDADGQAAPPERNSQHGGASTAAPPSSVEGVSTVIWRALGRRPLTSRFQPARRSRAPSTRRATTG